MIKGTLLSGLLWVSALGLAAPADAGAARHLHSLGISAASAGCLGAPGTWLPGTLQLEESHQAPERASLGPLSERTPNQPDCALV